MRASLAWTVAPTHLFNRHGFLEPRRPYLHRRRVLSLLRRLTNRPDHLWIAGHQWTRLELHLRRPLFLRLIGSTRATTMMMMSMTPIDTPLPRLVHLRFLELHHLLRKITPRRRKLGRRPQQRRQCRLLSPLLNSMMNHLMKTIYILPLHRGNRTIDRPLRLLSLPRSILHRRTMLHSPIGRPLHHKNVPRHHHLLPRSPRRRRGQWEGSLST